MNYTGAGFPEDDYYRRQGQDPKEERVGQFLKSMMPKEQWGHVAGSIQFFTEQMIEFLDAQAAKRRMARTPYRCGRAGTSCARSSAKP